MHQMGNTTLKQAVGRAIRTPNHEMVLFNRQPQLSAANMVRYEIVCLDDIRQITTKLILHGPRPFNMLACTLQAIKNGDSTYRDEVDKGIRYLYCTWKGLPIPLTLDNTDDWYCPRILNWLRGDYFNLLELKFGYDLTTRLPKIAEFYMDLFKENVQVFFWRGPEKSRGAEPKLLTYEDRTGWDLMIGQSDPEPIEYGGGRTSTSSLYHDRS